MKKSLLSLLVLAGLLTSCGKMKDPEFRQIENVRMGKLSLGSSIIRLDMRYFNPNSFNARLKHAEGDAWIDSAYLGHFTVDSLVEVPSKSEFLVPVRLEVDMKYLLQHSLTSLQQEDVGVRIAGSARAGRSGVFKNVPLKYEGRQDLRKLFK